MLRLATPAEEETSNFLMQGLTANKVPAQYIEDRKWIFLVKHPSGEILEVTVTGNIDSGAWDDTSND